MNTFIVEPTAENLERYKRVQGEKVYWHTADFFWFDPSLEDELAAIFDAYMDALMESEEDDDDEAIRKLIFPIGRLLIKAAQKAGISPQDYRDQFNNYATVIWTPICIWYKDESGHVRHTLKSNL
jgi:hypothetical protein